jgi:hypothetical protein
MVKLFAPAPNVGNSRRNQQVVAGIRNPDAWYDPTSCCAN